MVSANKEFKSESNGESSSGMYWIMENSPPFLHRAYVSLSTSSGSNQKRELIAHLMTISFELNLKYPTCMRSCKD